METWIRIDVYPFIGFHRGDSPTLKDSLAYRKLIKANINNLLTNFSERCSFYVNTSCFTLEAHDVWIILAASGEVLVSVVWQ